MSITKTWTRLLAATALLAAATGAQAAVVGFSPNADLSAAPFTIDFGNGAATYTFSDSGERGGFFGTSAFPAVTTGGTATIASLGAPFYDPPRPSTYFTDPGRAPFFDDSLLAQFLSYSAPATINAETDSFVALRFALNDGVHFGFARLSQLTLFDYAYETVAGKGIQTGPISAVPVPAAMPLLGLAVAALGGLGLRRRKRAA